MSCAGNIRPLTLPSYAHHVPPAGKVLSSFYSVYILSSCTERERKRIRGVECSTDRVVINTGGQGRLWVGAAAQMLACGGTKCSSAAMVWNTIEFHHGVEYHSLPDLCSRVKMTKAEAATPTLLSANHPLYALLVVHLDQIKIHDSTSL